MLSKSTYIRSLQCLKSLYLHKKRPFLRDPLSPEQRAKFERGTEIGILARELFPEGVDCSMSSPLQFKKALERTQVELSQGTMVLYEAAFTAEEVLIYLDILIKTDGGYRAIEVKSSRKLSQTYIEDAALQYHVLIGAGISVESFELVHINDQYEWEEPPNLHELFKFVDVTEELKRMQNRVSAGITAAKKAVTSASSPDIRIGKHCFKPYPCDFQGHCWKRIPSPSIWDLPGLTLDEKDVLMEEDLSSLQKFVGNESIDTKLTMQAHALMNGEQFKDELALQGLMEELRKDIIIVSILYAQPAKPLILGAKPYGLHPFMISLGVSDSMDQMSHYFFDYQETRSFDAEQLMTALSKVNGILVWDENEAKILQELSSELGTIPDIIVLSKYYGRDFFLAGASAPNDLFDIGMAMGMDPLDSKWQSRQMIGHQYVKLWEKKDPRIYSEEWQILLNSRNIQIMSELRNFILL